MYIKICVNKIVLDVELRICLSYIFEIEFITLTSTSSLILANTQRKGTPKMSKVLCKFSAQRFIVQEPLDTKHMKK